MYFLKTAPHALWEGGRGVLIRPWLRPSAAAVRRAATPTVGWGGLVGPPGDDSSAEGHPLILAYGRYAAVSTVGASYEYAWWCC